MGQINTRRAPGRPKMASGRAPGRPKMPPRDPKFHPNTSNRIEYLDSNQRHRITSNMTTSTRMHGLKSNTSHRIHRNAPGISTACERQGFPGGARTAKSAPEWPVLAWDSPKSVEFRMAPPSCPGFSIFTPRSSTTANCQRHGSAPSGLVAAIACEGQCRARNIGYFLNGTAECAERLN